MRIPLAFCVFLLIATAVFGQSRGGYNTYGSNSGFGSVVFPGTGHAPGTFSITNPGFATRLGATVAGSPIGTRNLGPRRRSTIGVLPYAYPVAIGGYGYGYDSYGQAQPNVTVVAPPQQQAPQVIINQTFVSGTPAAAPDQQAAPSGDGFHMYQSPSASYDAPAAEPRYFLIAYNDHSIYPALAYWTEGNVLHYVTTQNTHNQASLDLIDLAFTKRLNQDRNVEFSLTPGR